MHMTEESFNTTRYTNLVNFEINEEQIIFWNFFLFETLRFSPEISPT